MSQSTGKLKKLIIVNGTMGVGKTTVCQELRQRLQNSVWLDGDWCWMMNPWDFNDENKAMVMSNISYLLNNFLANSFFDYIIFSWVIHTDDILHDVLAGLNRTNSQVYPITLMCNEKELAKRILQDKRSRRPIHNNLNRLKACEDMHTIKIDTSNKPVEEVVCNIINLIHSSEQNY